MVADIVEQGEFDRAEYRTELEAAPGNLAVGTTLLFENDSVKVWEVKLEPGERGPFHAHTRNYFWTVVEGGRGLQRLEDGTFTVRDYHVGDTMFLENTAATALIHDLENVGNAPLRYVTVELIDD